MISPLLANIYLNVLDETWEREYRHLGKLVRFADDFVALCRSRAQAEEALRRIGEILGQLGLELHSERHGSSSWASAKRDSSFWDATCGSCARTSRGARTCFGGRLRER